MIEILSQLARPREFILAVGMQVYEILRQEVGRSITGEEDFIFWFEDTCDMNREFRFGGKLGFGGKFYRSGTRWYISCYREDETPEREAIIERTNARLEAFREEVLDLDDRACLESFRRR